MAEEDIRGLVNIRLIVVKWRKYTAIGGEATPVVYITPLSGVTCLLFLLRMVATPVVVHLKSHSYHDVRVPAP